MRTRRLTLVVGCFVAVLSSCSGATSPGALPVRGLGFYDPVTALAIVQLERVGTVLAVVHSARVVMVASNASSATLAGVRGATEVGPVLGFGEALQLEAVVRFDAAPTPQQLAALTTIGAITSEHPEAHTYILLVPLKELPRLDDVPGAADVAVLIDHAVP